MYRKINIFTLQTNNENEIIYFVTKTVERKRFDAEGLTTRENRLRCISIFRSIYPSRNFQLPRFDHRLYVEIFDDSKRFNSERKRGRKLC